jgi:hypothetical protein
MAPFAFVECSAKRGPSLVAILVVVGFNPQGESGISVAEKAELDRSAGDDRLREEVGTGPKGSVCRYWPLFMVTEARLGTRSKLVTTQVGMLRLFLGFALSAVNELRRIDEGMLGCNGGKPASASGTGRDSLGGTGGDSRISAGIHSEILSCCAGVNGTPKIEPA